MLTILSVRRDSQTARMVALLFVATALRTFGTIVSYGCRVSLRQWVRHAFVNFDLSATGSLWYICTFNGHRCYLWSNGGVVGQILARVSKFQISRNYQSHTAN